MARPAPRGPSANRSTAAPGAISRRATTARASSPANEPGRSDGRGAVCSLEPPFCRMATSSARSGASHGQAARMLDSDHSRATAAGRPAVPRYAALREGGTGMSRKRPTRRTGRVAAALLCVAVVTSLMPGAAAEPHSAAAGPTVKVLTRNLYFGADLLPAIATRTTPELMAAVAGIYSEVQYTDFPARAKVLAREIARAA